MSTIDLPPYSNPVLVDILARGQVATADNEMLPLHSHVPLLECRILQEWVKATRPRQVLEIGLAYGISTLFLCDALEWCESTRYHIIDPYQARDWQNIGLLNVARAGYAAGVTFHEATSEHVLPQMHEAGLTFEFALVDGSHRADRVLFDVTHVDHLLTDAGLVALDDIQLPAVQAAADHLIHTLGYVPCPVPEPLSRNVTVRVRRLSNIPESRVLVLRKRA